MAIISIINHLPTATYYSSLTWQNEFRTHIAVGIKLFFRILSGRGWQ